MKPLVLAGAVCAVLAGGIAVGQQGANPGVLINRMSSVYRSMQSYRDSTAWKRKIEDKDFTAQASLSMQRPNRYALEVKGEHMNTLVTSDGAALVAFRPDRKAYTKVRAPQTLMRADVLAGVEQPLLGSRMISLLLEGNLREGDKDVADSLSKATISGPSAFGDKFAYVLTMPWGDDREARIYVTADDYLLRRVLVYKGGSLEITENYSDIQINPSIPADSFTRTLPQGARLVASLPGLQDLTQIASVSEGWGNAPDFTVKTVEGRTLTLSKLKGKVILLNFYFNH